MCTKIDSRSFQTFLASFFILFLAFTSSAFAQDCGCDHIIGPETGQIKAVDRPDIKPGDVVCIKAGVRSRLRLVGFKGTKEQPIIFKNCGGQVIFDKTVDNTTSEGSLVFVQSQYFHVTGTGSPEHKYGFLVRKTNGSAIHATDSDYEFDHIEIADAGFAGFFTKIEALCNNTEYHRGNYTIRNVSIHDNYVHDTHGEGLYIGSSWWHGKSTECGTLYPPEIHGLRVYNNIVENTGADGMQIGCATQDAEVYNNVIRNYGHDPFSPVHTNGLMLNGGFQGKVYNNTIIDGAGMGLNCFGIGNVYMYNNLIVRAGTDGIFIDERGPVLPNAGIHTHNNTVIAPKRDGIRMYSGNTKGNTFVNNIVVAPGSLGTEYYNKDQYLYIKETNIDYTQNNNLFVPTIAELKFVNAGADDYQLQVGSPAVDKGANLSYFGFDLNKVARPIGSSFDIGAYEYAGSVRSSNTAPTASAGSDKTITLPTSSLSLTATATDTDGSIASVQWTKVSGPAATLAGATTTTLALSSLLEGTYTFRFTATDNSGATASDEAIVTVKAAPVAANVAPVANAGTDKSITLPTNSISLTGSATDSDGTISTYSWSKVSGPAATLSGQATATLSLSALVEGAYTFRLTATDNAGATATDDVVVTVNAAAAPANTAPTASAGSDKTITLPTSSLSLTATATDTDGSIASVQWTKVSGPTATLAGATTTTLALSNLLEGTYTFRFTATDNSGATASDEAVVTVKAAPVAANVAPVANAGTDKSITLPTNSISLTGSATDSDGTISTYSWSKVSGPAATLSGQATATLSLSALVEGAYTFRLTAKDNTGATASDDVIVTVKAAPVTSVSGTNGVNFSYYTSGTKAWRSLPNFSTLTPVKTGIINNFVLTPKTQANYFGFVFEGLIEIAKAGTYTFYSNSDDGSQLFVKGTMVVNNDGTHTAREKSGSIYLTAGKHPIKVTYFDGTKSETLQVRYAGPGISKQLIPDNLLYPSSSSTTTTTTNVTPATTLAAPSNLTATLKNENTAVTLSWKDNSATEDGFEIYRGIGADGAYELAGTTGSNVISYTVGNLVVGQVYTFSVRAKDGKTVSSYSNEVQVGETSSLSSSLIQTTTNSGARVLVNFTYNLAAGTPWNNFNEDPDTGDKLANMLDEQGKATGITLTLQSPWGWEGTGGNGWNNYGMITNNNSGVYADEVMKSSFWTERTAGEEILVSGLTPGKGYTFTFFGSRNAGGDRTTHYSIGKTNVSLNCAYNTSKTVSISNAIADASGKLTIRVKKGANSTYGYLNAMVIEASATSVNATTTKHTGTSTTETTTEETAPVESKLGAEAYTAYPNPAREFVTLGYEFVKPFSQLNITIIDLSGNVRLTKVETATDENGSIRIDLDDDQMPTGYYIIQIQSEQSRKTVKFLKL